MYYCQLCELCCDSRMCVQHCANYAHVFRYASRLYPLEYGRLLNHEALSNEKKLEVVLKFLACVLRRTMPLTAAASRPLVKLVDTDMRDEMNNDAAAATAGFMEAFYSHVEHFRANRLSANATTTTHIEHIDIDWLERRNANDEALDAEQMHQARIARIVKQEPLASSSSSSSSLSTARRPSQHQQQQQQKQKQKSTFLANLMGDSDNDDDSEYVSPTPAPLPASTRLQRPNSQHQYERQQEQHRLAKEEAMQQQARVESVSSKKSVEEESSAAAEEDENEREDEDEDGDGEVKPISYDQRQMEHKRYLNDMAIDILEGVRPIDSQFIVKLFENIDLIELDGERIERLLAMISASGQVIDEATTADNAIDVD